MPQFVVTETKNGTLYRTHLVTVPEQLHRQQTMFDSMRRAMSRQTLKERRWFRCLGTVKHWRHVIDESPGLLCLEHADVWEFAEYAGYDHRCNRGRLDGRGARSFDPTPAEQPDCTA